MFVDTGPFPFLLKQLITSPEIYQAVTDYLDWRSFGLLFSFPFLALRAFFVGIIKTKVLILGRNSSRTYQHPFQLPVNIYLKIWDSRIGNSLNASRNGIVNHSPYPYVEKD